MSLLLSQLSDHLPGRQEMLSQALESLPHTGDQDGVSGSQLLPATAPGIADICKWNQQRSMFLLLCHDAF